MTKTDNEKYVKRGAGMSIGYNPERGDEVIHAKVAPRTYTRRR